MPRHYFHPASPGKFPSIPAHTELSALRAGLGVSGLGRKHCSYLAQASRSGMVQGNETDSLRLLVIDTEASRSIPERLREKQAGP